MHFEALRKSTYFKTISAELANAIVMRSKQPRPFSFKISFPMTGIVISLLQLWYTWLIRITENFFVHYLGHRINDPRIGHLRGHINIPSRYHNQLKTHYPRQLLRFQLNRAWLLCPKVDSFLCLLLFLLASRFYLEVFYFLFFQIPFSSSFLMLW